MRQWYTMKKTDAENAEILIYDEIGQSMWGEDTVSAKSFDADLKALGDVKNINLRINSPGGSFFDGLAIHNTIKNHAATFTAYIDGIAASAASYIAMAADKIVMPKNSFQLVHGVSGFSIGNASDMRAMAEDLDRLDKSATATYVARTGKTTAKVEALMKEDRLIDATECLDFGLCDEVGPEMKMAAKYSLRLLPKNAADKITAVVAQSAGEPNPPSVPEAVGAGPAAGSGAGPAPADGNVVAIDKARNEGMAQHAKYVGEVNDLCFLANKAAMARDFIKQSMPVEKVREKLMAERGTDEPEVHGQHPLATTNERDQSTSAWRKIAEKLNARKKA